MKRIASLLLALALLPQPFAQGQCQPVDITCGTGQLGDGLGNALGINDDWIFIGVPGDDSIGLDRGSVQVQLRSNPGVCAQTLTASDSMDLAGFGAAINVLGTTLAIGAPGDRGEGAVYLFELSAGTWVEVAKLTAPDPGQGHRFGGVVELPVMDSANAPFIVVGAPGHGFMGPATGKAYVFRSSPTGWTIEDELISDAPAAGDGFASAIHSDEFQLLVGAPGDDRFGTDAGIVLAFGSNSWGPPQGWGQGSIQSRPDVYTPRAGDRFGTSIEGFDYFAAVGAPGNGVNGFVVTMGFGKGSWILSSSPLGFSPFSPGAPGAAETLAFVKGAHWISVLFLSSPALGQVSVFQSLPAGRFLSQRIDGPPGFGRKMAATDDALVIAAPATTTSPGRVFLCDGYRQETCGIVDSICPPVLSSTNSLPSMSIQMGIPPSPEFRLYARQIPVGSPVVFFAGLSSAMIPLGVSSYCVGGGAFRLGPPVITGSTGQASQLYDRLSPELSGQFGSFAQWWFQAVYFDQGAPPAERVKSTGAFRFRFCPI